jgi:leader peptidase (prepilin peptidase)/N-methyltransferase
MSSEHVIALLLSPLVGSFLGVIIDRLPAGRSIVSGRSCCDHCGHRLAAIELIPLISYLRLGGRCAGCGARLRSFYPLIELAALAVALSAAAVLSGGLFWLSLGLGWCLLVLAAIDARHLILPDRITLPLIPLGLALACWLRPEAIAAHVAGALSGFFALAAIAWLYRHLRGRDGLGLGDAKLLAAAGAWLGWQALPGLVLIAAVTALMVALAVGLFSDRLNPATEIAFGPYLALAFWISWLYGPLVLA